MHVRLFQDAEELIKIVPGLTDGYYHKVTCPYVITLCSMRFNEQHRAILCYLNMMSAMQGFALYHLDDYAGELDSMLPAMFWQFCGQCSHLLLFEYHCVCIVIMMHVRAVQHAIGGSTIILRRMHSRHNMSCLTVLNWLQVQPTPFSRH